MRLSLALLATCALSCTGDIAGRSDDEFEPGEGPSSSSDGTGADAGAAAPGGAGAPAPGPDGWPVFRGSRAYQLRRLTTEQYLATVHTLLGVDTTDMPEIEQVSPAGGFSAIGASTASVSSNGVAQFEDAARFLAEAVFAPGGPRDRVVPCEPSGVDDTACFEAFVRGFGQKAFRRPLDEEEVARYAALTAEIAAATGDADQGLQATLSAFLQSPNFLYLPEIGEPDPDDDARHRFEPYAIASRLSYFLIGDMPDDALMEAAASGALLTPDGIAEQAARLLDLSAAHASVGTFFTNLLSLGNLDTLARPVEVFPQFTATLGPAMKQETLLGIDDLIFVRDGDYRDLYDQRVTFVNAELAALYGIDPPSGDGFERVMLPDSAGRAGLLGQAGVLAARDHADGTSPTKRGLFILTRLLCQDLPLMPPANLQIPPPPSGNLTARERLEQHAENEVCASCHRTMDPVGLSLEHFDAMGAYRETDHGLTIDDTGVIGGREYHGVVGLGAIMHDHPALGPCLIQSLYNVAVGHLATEFDRDSFAAMVSELDNNDGRIRALLAAIAGSDGFRYLPVPED